MSGAPHPKSVQLARGERRYRRKVASPKQWQAIIAAKCCSGYCRICSRSVLACDPHHLVPRGSPFFGDDVEDNICGICRDCHDAVTRGGPNHLKMLAARLTDAEYAYVVAKLGEGGMERLFGVGRS